MTQEEHFLMLGTMAGLFRYCNVLFQILKSNGLASEADLPAFAAMAGSDLFHSKVLDADADIRLFVDYYRQQAESFGLRPFDTPR